MKTIKHWMLALVVALAALIPLQDASAWGPGGGGYGGHWRGGGYPSRWGGYHGGNHRGYHGGHWNGGAAVAGLAIGTIIGAAMVNASRPPVVVAPPPPPPVECRSVRVNGILYYNCDGY